MSNSNYEILYSFIDSEGNNLRIVLIYGSLVVFANSNDGGGVAIDVPLDQVVPIGESLIEAWEKRYGRILVL